MHLTYQVSDPLLEVLDTQLLSLAFLLSLLGAAVLQTRLGILALVARSCVGRHVALCFGEEKIEIRSRPLSQVGPSLDFS